VRLRPCIDDHAGAPFEYGKDPTEASMFYGIYEADDWRLVRAFLKPGMTAVDVGANIGWYSSIFAGMVWSNNGVRGRVFAVEPFPDNLGRLERAKELLPLPETLVIIQGVCSDTDGPLELFLNRFHPGHSIMKDVAQNYAFTGQSIVVPSMTLDTLAREHKIDRIDFLKIDVEGAELLVIRGALGILQSICNIMVEITDIGGERADTVHDILITNGFAAFIAKRSRLQPFNPSDYHGQQRNIFYLKGMENSKVCTV
jgi:FkbM family methyltransferase